MAFPSHGSKPAADPADPPFPPSPLAGEAPKDLGFGSVLAAESRVRLMNRDGSFNVQRGGPIASVFGSPYHFLLTIPWLPFLGVLAATYLIANAVFGLAYFAMGPATLGESDPAFRQGTFLQAFFFSVQTFATIGYGSIIPVTKLANAIVLCESFVSLVSIALATGLIFARFSRPTPRIRFSRCAIVAPYRGGRGFMFRIANAGRSEITGIEASVTLARFETVGATRTRVFTQLALERTSVVFFSLSWTIVHPIDETSPLWGMTSEDLLRSGAEFLILLSGTDETFFQTVTARGSYTADEIRWGRRFTNIFLPPTSRGVVRIDLRRLDSVEDAALPSVDGKGADTTSVSVGR
jgi:inward rectifier potassium channel